MRTGIEELKNKLEGDFYTDDLYKILYSTDASAYREKPIAVTRPKSVNDIKALIKFANQNQFTLIPRAAGTSLAGQVVGNGIVVDISKYWNKIIEINVNEKWVRIQPGVVLDELNKYLKEYGLFFGPETSTSSRCMLGGMFGNNSCGSHSILYGSTRDHVLEAKVILSDGSEAVFNDITKSEFLDKCKLDTLEGKIYKNINKILSSEDNRTEIINEYPAKELNRRNNGYAIDQLIDNQIFSESDKKFNLCKLLAGSEGTLAFTTELKLNLVDVPFNNVGVLAVHCNSLEEAYASNLIALEFNPGAVELIDDKILKCTEENITQTKNRSFIDGLPAALLVVEFNRETKEEINEIALQLKAKLKAQNLGFHYPLLFNKEVGKVWALRKAGLGLLSNIPGDKKAEPFIEDTAVLPRDLASYIKELDEMLKKYNLDCVHYAHIGSGELHLRPILNLKDKNDVELFHTILEETAHLVKKYKGSLSGEHGDGRLRGEFIPIIIGQKNYELCKQLKVTWDPKNIFNPGKIVDTPKMNETLRYVVGKADREIETIFDFSKTLGIQKASEKCNGSADCRNSKIIGGVMCPSFKATLDEKHSTRARANIFREFITRSEKANPFDHKEIYEVMDLCLSCKACKSECPSSVDITKLKAEFLQHYYDSNGIPLRTRVIANISLLNKYGAFIPGISNLFIKSGLLKKMLGISSKRNLPTLAKESLLSWYKKNFNSINTKYENGKVYFFCDEFTNYNDVEVGKKAILLLNKLGYQVEIPEHLESGRAYLSKGFLRKAKQIADTNISKLKSKVSKETPLVGIEPSAILTFRDEYIDLSKGDDKETAKILASSTFMIEEFLQKEMLNGKIKPSQFNGETKKIKLHGHCHQKSISTTEDMKDILSLPKNYLVEEIPSGCCGMAGAFGYEKEHYDISMKIGELVLFPEVRKANDEDIISAPGTSCRHQIFDGTGKKAYHPVEILYDALVD